MKKLIAWASSLDRAKLLGRILVQRFRVATRGLKQDRKSSPVQNARRRSAEANKRLPPEDLAMDDRSNSGL